SFARVPSPSEIAALSLHDALPISREGAPYGCTRGRSDRAPRALADARSGRGERRVLHRGSFAPRPGSRVRSFLPSGYRAGASRRSEEHTSELQSRENLVCRLLLEK